MDKSEILNQLPQAHSGVSISKHTRFCPHLVQSYVIHKRAQGMLQGRETYLQCADASTSQHPKEKYKRKED